MKKKYFNLLQDELKNFHFSDDCLAEEFFKVMWDADELFGIYRDDIIKAIKNNNKDVEYNLEG